MILNSILVHNSLNHQDIKKYRSVHSDLTGINTTDLLSYTKRLLSNLISIIVKSFLLIVIIPS